MTKTVTKSHKKPNGRTSKQLIAKNTVRHNVDLSHEAAMKLDLYLPVFHQKNRKPLMEYILEGIMRRDDALDLIHTLLNPTKKASDEKKL